MRVLARLLAALLLVPVIALAVAGVIAPWSPSGWLALATVALAAWALLVAGRRARRFLGSVVGTLLVVLLGVRVVGAAVGRIRMLTLPGGTSSRWAGRILDEQDLSLLGARVLGLLSRLPRDERERLVPALRDAYMEMGGELGITPSPVLDTLFERQKPSAFDTLVIEPRGAPSPDAGVVFLHGYAGSFTLECWLVSRAAGAIHAVTVCPATGSSGHWGGRDGELTLRGTLDYLRARGIRRVYLAGLSNGSVGAGALAQRFASSLAGLVLISGTPSEGGTGGLPILVVQGENDTMASAAKARAFATRTHASYAGFDGGHFVLLTRPAETREAIAGWLRQVEGPE